MAGASTAALAAAVSNAGALGGFGGTDTSPDELREVIRAIRQRTNKPFIVNLYLDRTESCIPVAEHVAALKIALAPVHAELQAGQVPDPIGPLGNFDRQIAVVLEEQVPVLSSHFGAPDAAVMRALKMNGTKVLATACELRSVERPLRFGWRGAAVDAGARARIGVDTASPDGLVARLCPGGRRHARRRGRANIGA
jgi:nitronate monooxygenase